MENIVIAVTYMWLFIAEGGDCLIRWHGRRHCANIYHLMQRTLFGRLMGGNRHPGDDDAAASKVNSLLQKSTQTFSMLDSRLQAARPLKNLFAVTFSSKSKERLGSLLTPIINNRQIEKSVMAS